MGATRQHSRFVHFVLPWLMAAGGALVFLLTLNRWVSLESLGLVSRVAGWDWSTMQLAPVTLVVTAPLRWFPDAWQPAALSALSALLAGLTLGLLAKSVALLPHDRTREQRVRERSDFSFLTVPLAWVPPVAAAGLLAFQLTFWEHATAMTGSMVDLALFALCVFCYLRFRVLQEDKYLAWLSFAFGAACANDWGMIGFGPLFFIAIVWGKGIAFFDARFLIRTTAAGLAGLLFYLVQPIAVTLSGQADGTVFELLRTQLGYQRQWLFTIPPLTAGLCALTSIVPAFFIGLRWPSTFGDLSAAGAAITNLFFRLIHVAFLVVAVWTMFDPPFSPRELGFGLPFLRFYFLTALVAGYAAGYLILVLGQEPEQRLRRPSEGLVILGRASAGLVTLLAIASAPALAIHNHKAIRGQNGSMLREVAETLLPDLQPNTVLLSDESDLAILSVGLVRTEGREPVPIALQTPLLRHHAYQRHLEKTLGPTWPALNLEALSNPVGDDVVLQQIYRLSLSNRLFYLHPSFGYFSEPFYLVPTNAIYTFATRSLTNSVTPPVPDAAFASASNQWTRLRQRWADDPDLARLKDARVSDARRVAAHLSRGFNAWGVTLQRRGLLPEAARFFAAAIDIDDANLAAVINSRFNKGLQAGLSEAVVLEQALNDQLGRFRDLSTLLLHCGPADEPSFCYRLGRTFQSGQNFRQAVDQFARALELQPDSVDTRIWLASSKLSAQLADEALADVAAIRRDVPNLTATQLTDLAAIAAWATFRKGDLAGAEKVLIDAQRAHPDQLELLRTLNDIYIVANQTNSALTAVNQLIERLPDDPRPLITKSAILMQTGALEEAIDTLNKVLDKDPGFVPALVNRALAYFRLKRLDEAERDYLRLHDAAPRVHSIYYHLGEIDYQRRDVIGARKNFKKFLESALPGSPEARRAQERLDAVAAGKFDDGA